MANPPSKIRSNSAGKQEYERSSPAVTQFLADLEHPHKTEWLALRELILSAGPEIQEGIKWNAPSFWSGAWFATFQLRAKSGIVLVLHQGAKLASPPKTRFVEDPDKLLFWITNDRCTVSLAGADDLNQKSKALKSVIREWSQKVALRSRKAS